MSQSTPESHDVRERVRLLPIVGEGAPLLTRRKAQAVIHDLNIIDPTIVERVQEQVGEVVDEMHTELDQGPTGEYRLSEDELRGVVARSALRGAAQVASDIGGAVTEIREIEGLLILTGAEQPSQAEQGDS